MDAGANADERRRASNVGDFLEICGRQRHRWGRERTRACWPKRADAGKDEQDEQE